MTDTRLRTLAMTLALAITAAACGGGSDASGPPSSDTQVPSTSSGGSTGTSGDTGTTESSSAPVEAMATEVLTVEDPIAMVLRPDDDLVWLAERSGRIHALEAGPDGTLTEVGDPVLDISDRTKAQGEQGLLGMAFSADGSELYVSYTNLDGNTRLVAYDVGTPPAHDGPLVADAGTVLFELDQPFANHNGGHVVLGPDGLLWFGLGDGGAGDDQTTTAAMSSSVPTGCCGLVSVTAGPATTPTTGLRTPTTSAARSCASTRRRPTTTAP